MNRAQRNIDWIEFNLKFPDGPKRGEQFVLSHWQKTLMVKIYNNDVPTRQAILSFARKNGKSTFAAALLLLHFIGPEAFPGSQLYSAARSRDQAALIFGYASKMLRQSPNLLKHVRIVASRKELRCKALDSAFRSLSSDATTAYGANPVFVIHDELGQVKGPSDELYDSLETAMAAQDQPMSIVISTQAATDDDLLSVLIDDAMTGKDPSIVCEVYSADEVSEPISEAGLAAANPGMLEFMSPVELRRQMDKAIRLPSSKVSFQNLHLNMRVSGELDFITREEWMACKGEMPDMYDCDELFGGLDLSKSRDLTAFVIAGCKDDHIYIYPTFWLPRAGLEERAEALRVPYDRWWEQGFLQTTPGTLVDHMHAAREIHDIFGSGLLKLVAYDTWGYPAFIPHLINAGFADWQVDPEVAEKDEMVFKIFGQGYKSMDPAVKTLERKIVERELTHSGNPVMNMCLANVVVTMDPAGNRKFDKSKAKRSIDGAVAMLMAVETAVENRTPPVDPNFNIESLFERV